jgi:CRISPR-associated endonuclease Csn1
LLNGDEVRLKNAFDSNGKFVGNQIFPFRKNYEDEFEKIWDKQAEFYSNILTKDNKQIVKDIIFFQRPLKEQEEGFCIFEHDEKRIAKAHPLFQKFRILQNLNNLKLAKDKYSCYEDLTSDQDKNL